MGERKKLNSLCKISAWPSQKIQNKECPQRNMNKKKYLQDLLQLIRKETQQPNRQRSKDHGVFTEKEIEMAFQHMKDAQPHNKKHKLKLLWKKVSHWSD